MPALALKTKEHGQITLPTHRVAMLKRASDGTALVVLVDGQEMPTLDPYQKVSDLMVSVRVWGSVNDE